MEWEEIHGTTRNGVDVVGHVWLTEDDHGHWTFEVEYKGRFGITDTGPYYDTPKLARYWARKLLEEAANANLVMQ